jgi:hypothetical protein
MAAISTMAADREPFSDVAAASTALGGVYDAFSGGQLTICVPWLPTSSTLCTEIGEGSWGLSAVRFFTSFAAYMGLAYYLYRKVAQLLEM